MILRPACLQEFIAAPEARASNQAGRRPGLDDRYESYLREDGYEQLKKPAALAL